MIREPSEGRRLSATEAFFQDLASRGREPILGRCNGTIRFDLLDGERVEHWFVTVRTGDIAVFRKRGRADVVATLEKALSEDILSGNTNAEARLLRGQIRIEGDLALMMQFQRLFPRPRASHSRGSARTEKTA